MPCVHCGRGCASDDAAADAARITRDCNGNVLANGETVVVIKGLNVRGSSIPLKRGTEIPGIRLVQDDPEHIEGHSERVRGLLLKACFLRKV